ncbi:MAG: transglycosylase SLT domain-containing protein [Anaerolineae bacterium]|nr:transglycosylase SLT domain-containing protein [Anaerolineae bacterium]
MGGRSETVLHFPPQLVEATDVATPRLYEAASRRPVPEPNLSPTFMPSVQYWKDDILNWSADYGIDPNLAATVMQIESCGNPEAQSSVGATSLFQVMPFHFEEGENPFDPDTNAKRGMAYLLQGLELSDGHAGLALAGYNGGHGVISRNYEDWPRETQNYYRWGSGIYREASAGWDSSPTLAAWLAAGGRSLCHSAESQLGLSSESR